MPTEIRPVRLALFQALQADPDFAALAPAVAAYPQAPAGEPSWPFVRPGRPAGTAFSAACADGDELDLALHTFAKPREVGGQVVETAEDHADRIGTTVVRALHRKRITLPSGAIAKVRRTGFQLLRDGAEADAYHHVANFRVRVLS